MHHVVGVVQGLDALEGPPLQGYMSKLVRQEDQGVCVRVCMGIWLVDCSPQVALVWMALVSAMQRVQEGGFSLPPAKL